MKKSFTLVEVLIAVVILALVIGAAAAAESLNIRTSGTNKRQLEALGLAQQGLNLSKSVNDNDKLNKDTPGWTPRFPNIPTGTPKNYKIDISNSAQPLPEIPNCPPPPTAGACANKCGEVINLNGIDYCREIIINK